MCVSCVAAASGVNDPEGSSEVGGYMTPRSLETPVCGSGHHISQSSHFSKATSSSHTTGFSSSTHQIRDPYASRVPSALRASNKSTKSEGAEQSLRAPCQAEPPTSHKHHQPQHREHPLQHHNPHQHKKTKDIHQNDSERVEGSDNDDTSIYTILIRFPAASKTVDDSKTRDQRSKSATKKSANSSIHQQLNNFQRSRSIHEAGYLPSNQHPHRTSIQMLLESPADDENSPMVSSDMRSSVNIEGKDRKESTQFPCGFADYGFAAIISKWIANFD